MIRRLVRTLDERTGTAPLLRENLRTKNSQIMFTDDEARTWSKPRDLPLSLTGDRHTLKYAPDGRLLVTFRDRTFMDRELNKADVDKHTEVFGDAVAV